MITFFNRGWFRTEIFVRKSPEEFLTLVQELETRMKEICEGEDFKNLSDPKKTNVLDQYKTAMDVCWTRVKELNSKKYLSCSEEEKTYYAKKNNKVKLNKEKINALYNKEEFQTLLANVNDKNEYLKLIIDQINKLDSVINTDEFKLLHVLEQRKVRDMYASSTTLSWRRYITSVVQENKLMSEFTKSERKIQHIKERRKRHSERGVKKAEFKKTKNHLIEEMKRLPLDEFNRIQKELEMEYRQLRNLPIVPEV